MTDYTSKLRDPDDTLQMFKRYSIACADGNREGVDYENLAGAYDNIRHGTVGDDNLLRHVKLHKSISEGDHGKGIADANARVTGTPEQFGILPGDEQLRLMALAREAENEYRETHRTIIRGATTLMSDNAMAPGADRAPCYFLPWDPGGAAIELTIPVLPDEGATADTHPPVFLTAALSGCSIFVRGTTKNPTIFHCGSQFDTTGTDATEYWTGAMRQILGEGADLGGGRAHNRDYMTPKRGETGIGVDMSDAADTRFKAHYKDFYRVEETNPWGAVFGIRRGADWEFYLQENVTVTYRKLLPPTGFFKKFKKKKPDDEARKVSRPVMVRKIFPGGGGAVKLVKRWRTLRY
ncbi:MAG: hypothetical protein AAFP68_20420 [Pseudomonadota bacterium]